MRFKFVLLSQLLACAFLAAYVAEAHTAPAFKSVHVELPSSDRAFDGPGSDVVNTNCLICHSAGMVLEQPPLPRATWQIIVEKMRNAYKAPVADEDEAPIVDYLSQLKRAK